MTKGHDKGHKGQMSDREAMKLALEALERANQTAMLFSLKARVPECGEFAGIAQDLDWAVETLRQALEQPEQNPVAYLYHDTVSAEFANPLTDSTLLVLACDRKPNGRNETPLYTAPPKREWVGLTDEEALALVAYSHPLMNKLSVARAIEAKLRDKNGF